MLVVIPYLNVEIQATKAEPGVTENQLLFINYLSTAATATCFNTVQLERWALKRNEISSENSLPYLGE